jgi:hypothetical protein
LNDVADSQPPLPPSPLEARILRLLEHPRLPRGVAVIAVVLATPCLFIGWFLDDYIGRYIYSDLEGAARFFRVISGGYGVANGNLADTHWQIEQGFAPWWTYPPLLLNLFRPISLGTHVIDFRLFAGSAFAMHAQSLAWLFALVFFTARMYRGVHGLRVGGMAAFLFAVDHTHGFAVGYITNRHALLAAAFGVACLGEHLSRRRRGQGPGIGAPILYAFALLAGESAVAVVGYLVSYAAFVETGPLRKRALGVAPYLVTTVLWRAAYNMAGYGGRGSGLYLDPARQPAQFLRALLERGPILTLGQFFAPPAEISVLFSHRFGNWILVGALVFAVLFAIGLVPLLRKDRLARFWLGGFVLSIVPAASTYPHNRQLLFSSFGAMALIAMLWQLHAFELKGKSKSLLLKVSGAMGAIALMTHLVVSPVVSPLTTCSIAFATPLQRAAERVDSALAGRDAIFLTAPDYFAVKLVQLVKRVRGEALPRRWRVLSFGPQEVRVRRDSERILTVHYEGGILGTPFMELYRDRHIPMARGETVTLEGLDIEVTAVTGDERVTEARFTFADPLDDPSFIFYFWAGDGFERLEVPQVGVTRTLPPAALRWSLQ